MGLVDDIKSVASTIQKIGNIELYQKILGLQAEAMAMVEENNRLKAEKRALEQELEIQGELVFERNCYWRAQPQGARDGPFCSNCWDTRNQLVRMHLRSHPDYRECPTCQRPVNITGRPPGGTPLRAL